MVRAMAAADGGDDCYGESTTAIALEESCAEMFGKEAALLMPTGTMSNQVGLRALLPRGQEVVCDATYHLNFFEAAPTCDLGGAAINPIDTPDGLLSPDVLEKALLRRARWSDAYASTGVIWTENTVNGLGGRVFPWGRLAELWVWAQHRGISVYLDGARVLNACVATGTRPEQFGGVTTAMSLCFAKGLGAPMGSVLLGSRAFIETARRFRKWYGGALHQSGPIAAAALWALQHNVARLEEDHANATALAAALAGTGLVSVTRPDTNIVLFDLADLACDAQEFVALAERVGVRLLIWRDREIRAVFSLEVSAEDSRAAASALCGLIERIGPAARHVA
jgi:threonine aldolase